MKKIRITESQWEKILMAESAYPLDLKSDDEKPANFTEYEVAVNNNDPDAESNVTIGDKISKSETKPGWFGMNRYPAMHRLPESAELDNAENSGFGVNNDAFINKSAKSNGGKMVSNISNEINSDKRGSRNNTNQVRISRMENYKKNSPELFMKNGGDKMLDILKSQTKKQADSYKEKHAEDVRTQSTQPGDNVNYGKENNGAFYFK